MSLAYTNDPGSAANPGTKYPSCQLLERAILEADCGKRSSIRSNSLACGRCASPFRTCIPCFDQHIPSHAQGRVNPKTGFCAFHAEHGADAVRSYEPPASIKAEPRRPAYPPLDPEVVARIPSDTIARAAIEEYPKLTRHNQKLMRLMAEGITNINRLALELDSDENTVYVIMGRLVSRFGIDIPSDMPARERAHLRAVAFSLIYQRATLS